MNITKLECKDSLPLVKSKFAERRTNKIDRYAQKKTKNIQIDVKREDPEREELDRARHELGEWITKMERGFYVDPEACNSTSQVHTVTRQLKVVVDRLRSRIELVNDEIKHLNRMRKDVGMTLEQLDQSLVYNKPLAYIMRPSFTKDQFKEQEIMLHARHGRTYICRNRMLEASRVLKIQFLKIRQQLLELNGLRSKVQNEINRLDDVYDHMPQLRSKIHRDLQQKKDDDRFYEYLARDKLQQRGILPHPVAHADKIRGIHHESHLPIHKRNAREKSYHPFSFEDRNGKSRRVFALTVGDTFRAMTTMAGASLIAIDQAVGETRLVRAQITAVVDKALEVENSKKRQTIMYGRQEAGKEYGCASDKRRPKGDAEWIYYMPHDNVNTPKRSIPIKNLI